MIGPPNKKRPLRRQFANGNLSPSSMLDSKTALKPSDHAVHWLTEPASRVLGIAQSMQAQKRVDEKCTAAAAAKTIGDELKRALCALRTADSELTAARLRYSQRHTNGADPEELLREKEEAKRRVKELHRRAMEIKIRFRHAQSASLGCLQKQMQPTPKYKPEDSRKALQEVLETNPSIKALRAKVLTWIKSYIQLDKERRRKEAAERLKILRAKRWYHDGLCDNETMKARKMRIRDKIKTWKTNLVAKQAEEAAARAYVEQKRAAKVQNVVDKQRRIAAVLGGAYEAGSFRRYNVSEEEAAQQLAVLEAELEYLVALETFAAATSQDAAKEAKKVLDDAEANLQKMAKAAATVAVTSVAGNEEEEKNNVIDSGETIEVVAKEETDEKAKLADDSGEKKTGGGGIESKVEDIRTAAAIDAGVSVVDPQHQQRKRGGIVIRYSRVKRAIAAHKLKHRGHWKPAGFRNGAMLVRCSKFTPAPDAAAKATTATAAMAVLQRQGTSYADAINLGLLGNFGPIIGGAETGVVKESAKVASTMINKSMQSVRVFSRPPLLVPVNGELKYPGEGEGILPNGAKGDYLPWYKRRNAKGLVMRGGRSPFHGSNWRRKRRTAPSARERSIRIRNLASKLFFECDRNGDGVVTRHELRTAVVNRTLSMQLLGLEHTHVGPFFDVDRIFETMGYDDEDENACLTLVEFSSYLENHAKLEAVRRKRKRHRPNKLQRWRELFELIDRNHDGHLSRLEFIKCINESPELAHELHELLELPEHIRQEDGTRDIFVRAFADMDEDSSGSIELAEFIDYLENLAKKAVKSATGRVSPKSSSRRLQQDVDISVVSDPASLLSPPRRGAPSPPLSNRKKQQQRKVAFKKKSPSLKISSSKKNDNDDITTVLPQSAKEDGQSTEEETKGDNKATKPSDLLTITNAAEPNSAASPYRLEPDISKEEDSGRSDEVAPQAQAVSPIPTASSPSSPQAANAQAQSEAPKSQFSSSLFDLPEDDEDKEEESTENKNKKEKADESAKVNDDSDSDLDMEELGKEMAETEDPY